MRRAVAFLAILPLAACAHGPRAPAEPQPIAEAPNARARLYGACIAQATQAGSYDRYGRYLRLTCTDAPAQALFVAMEPYARARGNVSVVDGVETRGLTSTTVNDRCWTRDGRASCLIIVPVGAFLDPQNDALPVKGAPSKP